MNVELVKTFHLEVAQKNAGGTARTARLHGHSLRVDVVCKGACEPLHDWLVDYGEISKAFEPVFADLDHRLVNDVLKADAVSVEDVAEYIVKRMGKSVPSLASVHVTIVGEDDFAPSRVSRHEALDLPERLAFTFEAAHFLPNLPKEHKCKRMHGHSFRVEAAAKSMPRLEEALEMIYKALDHRCLNEIKGLENATSEMVAKWIWDKLSAEVEQLKVVTVAETCTARCIYRGK
jgi:6-pyruvoyltetrahydropterin/6-carboxytetrahydropterin synthase